MLRVVITCLLTWLMSRTFLVLGLVLPCYVEGDSMSPTLEAGQRMVVDRTAFWLAGLRRWQVVVLRYPRNPGELCVKRIVGLPGETVEIRGGKILADGHPLADVPANLQVMLYPGQLSGGTGEYRVAVDEYFVLGDNGQVSEDSRTWQPPTIRREAIVGKPVGL